MNRHHIARIRHNIAMNRLATWQSRQNFSHDWEFTPLFLRMHFSYTWGRLLITDSVRVIVRVIVRVSVTVSVRVALGLALALGSALGLGYTFHTLGKAHN